MQSESVGSWLAERCRGLSMRKAAAKTGLSHATIADIIKGSNPSPETIKKLAEAFGGDRHHKLALEDKLLELAGYRTPRPGPEPELSLPQDRLMDIIGEFSEPQIEITARFAELVARISMQHPEGTRLKSEIAEITIEYTVNYRSSPATVELIVCEKSKGKTLRQLGQMFGRGLKGIRQVLVKYDGKQIWLLPEHRAAAELGYSVAWLINLRREGHIRPLGFGHLWLYSKQELSRIPSLIGEPRRHPIFIKYTRDYLYEVTGFSKVYLSGVATRRFPLTQSFIESASSKLGKPKEELFLL